MNIPSSIKTLSHTIPADLLNPLSMYLRIRDHFPQSLLLECTDFQNIQRGKTYLAIDPLFTFEAKKESCTLRCSKGISQSYSIPSKDIFSELFSFAKKFDSYNSSVEDGRNIFGFTGFEASRYAEPTLPQSKKPLSTEDLPEISYSFYRYVIVYTPFTQACILYENIPEGEKSTLHSLLKIIETPFVTDFPFTCVGAETSTTSETNFLASVEKAKTHCLLGDVFQLVLSRSFQQEYQGDPIQVYRKLRVLSPSPYLFYLDTGDYTLMGASPEAQLIVEDTTASIHPIAGTYKRTGKDALDQELAKKLLEDPKEMAEHTMLVDLARNDLSRYCTQVRLNAYKEIQFFSHVLHMVSVVEGTLSSIEDGFSLIPSCFPAGTLTGAPKYKAMELINTYEPHARGFYGGCVGMISPKGNNHQAILIRSILAQNNILRYTAGAGIVHTSDPIKELEEVDNKLTAVRIAIQQASKLPSFTF